MTDTKQNQFPPPPLRVNAREMWSQEKLSDSVKEKFDRFQELADEKDVEAR